MTAATSKPSRGKRAGVPAVDQATSSTSAIDALAAAPTTGLVEPIPLALLHPHPHNPRRDVGDITELADSIRAHGIRQNLLLVPDPDHPGEFRIVIGHRRAAGAAAAGLDVVPAVVDADLDEAGQLELMLLENLQRTDLTPVEEADGYQGLLDLGLSAAAIAKRTGRSPATVRSRIRLAGLPETARTAVHEHRATLEDAARIEAFADQPDLYEKLAEALGTREFDWRIRNAEYEKGQRRRIDEARAIVEAAGIPIVTPAAAKSWGPDRTHDDLFSVPPRKADALVDLPAGTVAVESFSSFEIRAPHDPNRIDPREQERLERERAQAEKLAPVNDFLTRTSIARQAFVLELLTGKRPFPRKAEDAVIRWTARYLATIGPLGDDMVDCDGWAEHEGQTMPPAQWVDAVVPAYPLLAVAAASHEGALGDHEPTNWGYSLLSREIYTRGWDSRQDVVAWYALLEELGYAVSDDERTALAAPAKDGEPS